MTTETKQISLHRALAELKLCDAKIEKATLELAPVTGKLKTES